MASLSAHLREAGDHGRLGFHPACPVCCEQRLSGALPSDTLVSGRAPALLAAGLLAFSSASPAVALAQEADEDQALAADPASTSGPGTNVNAGPDDTDEESDSSAAAGSVADDDTGPVGPDLVTEGDPAADPASSVGAPAPTASAAPAVATPAAQPGSVAAPATNTQAESGADTPAAADPAVPDAAGSSSPAPSTAPAGAPAAPAPAATSPRASATHGAPRDGNEQTAATKRVTRRRHGHLNAHRMVTRAVPLRHAMSPVATPAQPRVTTVAYVVQRPSVSEAPATVKHAGRAARRGDRVHVVLAGESLWSVAQDVLGSGAAVGDVAREVDRLWALNRERIGTGDRDLVPIGTRLVLR